MSRIARQSSAAADVVRSAAEVMNGEAGRLESDVAGFLGSVQAA